MAEGGEAGETAWAALVDAPPTDAWAVAPVSATGGSQLGFLAAWLSPRRPRAEAMRIYRAALDPGGAPASASLLLVPKERRVLFDDPAVQQARRIAIGEDRFPVVTTLSHDASLFAGSLLAGRDEEARMWLRDDPFSVVGEPRLVEVGAGLLATATALPQPVIERFGSAQPWPGSRF